MGPAEVLRRATEYLEHHGVPSARTNAEVLLMQVLGTDRAGLYTRTGELDTGEAMTFGRAICQRCDGTPLQHLTGEQGFRGLTLDVRPGVFVPRPETEVLVELALTEVRDVEAPIVVDVGTGTGAIALAVKDERPDARVFATDLAGEAVELARANALRLGLEVTVLQGDLLEPLPSELRGWIDLVVSNPPYLAPGELDGLPVDVRADPVLALVGDADLFDRLVEQATRWLRDGGALAVEIGASRCDEAMTAFRRSLSHVRIEPDLAGRDRVVLGRRP
jgi:release factor glutamine methyltransferase